MVPLVASTIAFVNACQKSERGTVHAALASISHGKRTRSQCVFVACHFSRSGFTSSDPCSFSGVPFQGLSVCLCEPQSLCCRGSSLGRSLLIELPFGGNAYAKGTP